MVLSAEDLDHFLLLQPLTHPHLQISRGPRPSGVYDGKANKFQSHMQAPQLPGVTSFPLAYP